MKTKLLLFTLLLSCLGFSQTIAIQSFATGFSSPSEITHPVGDSRLFVVEQTGIIKILNSNQTTNATPFLNLSSIISSGGERGLLGLAFHPNYATNGFFFVNYTNTAGNTVIARYSVSTTNPNVAQTTGTILMTITQPYSNHNGGCLRFGPDGFLYIAMGDGGSAGDPENRAQNINENLGKILRIDVNSTVAPFYTSPATNPYIGIAGNDEIWAIGVRNPWKFCFNTNGDMWIADVGQGAFEEINKIPNPQPGMNFGWRCYEGNANYNTTGCASSTTMTFPVAQYSHAGGNCSVTGGYVYNGTTYSAFANKYFFADYCVNRIGTLDAANAVVYSATFAGSNNFTTFGQDSSGELYVASGAGIVYKIIDANLATANFEKNGFSLYPNPAKESFNIKNSNNIQLSKVSVFDISGKELLSQNIENNADVVSTKSLSDGIYIAVLDDVSGNSYRSKLVVE